MGFLGGRGRAPTSFSAEYRCYPVAMIDKPQLEAGDKIVLPPSALDTLSRMETDYPMLFKVGGSARERSTHCGVMEFSAPEGLCYMPYWMMQSLLIEEGGFVRVHNVSLKKAKFVKFRPQSKTFLDISNPKAVLEKALRKYTCMTVGDQIFIDYNSQHYYIDVQEVRPDGQACIVETDMEVDFAPPADYVEPDWKGMAAAKAVEEAAAAAAASGGGSSAAPADAAAAAALAEVAAAAPSFQAFTGSGCRVDGKAAAESAGPALSAAAASASAAAPRIAATGVPAFAGAGSGARVDGKVEVRTAPPRPPTPEAPAAAVSGLARGRRNRKKLAPRRGFLDKLEAQQKSIASARTVGRVTKAFGGKGNAL